MSDANMRYNGENWGDAFDERKKGKRESRAGLVNVGQDWKLTQEADIPERRNGARPMDPFSCLGEEFES